MKKFYLTTILALIFFASSHAQTTSIYGVFPTIDHSSSLTKKLDYGFYYFGAFNLLNEEVNGVKDDANFFAFYAEQSLTYKLTKNLSVTGAYVYERQHPTENNYRNENRFYLQAAYAYSLKRTNLKHRLRYDGRFIQNRVTLDRPYTSRVRYLFGVNTPLRKGNDKLYLNMYNEFFFDLNSSGPLYSENWAYAGIGLKLNKNNAVEAGPLNIFWVNGDNSRINFLYLQLTWISHINFYNNNRNNNLRKNQNN